MSRNAKFLVLTLAVFFSLMPGVSQAVPVATAVAGDAITSAISGVTAQLQTLSFKWLSAFVLAQFFITNFSLLKSGADIEAVFGKLIGGLAWFSFCFYVVTEGPDFLKNVGNSMFDIAGGIAGSPGAFSAGYIFDWGFQLSKTLMNSVNTATGSSWFAKLDFLPSLFTFFSCLIIMMVSALIGFKIFLAKIELMITIMMSPLSFSFLGLNALKDQGMAPFKSLTSLVYRVLILAVIASAMSKVGAELVNVFSAVNSGSVTDIWNPVFAGLMVFSLMGYLAYKSDSMAANIASGSTNLGTGDVASAAAMGAAAGAAIATGGAAAAAGATKTGSAMSDFMKGLMGGGGGSVANASSSGAGPSPVGAAPQKQNLSLGGGNSVGASPAPSPSSARSSQPTSSNKPPSRNASNNSQDGGQAPKTSSNETGRNTGNSGSAATAGIGAPEPSLHQKLDNLSETLKQPQQEKGLSDHLSDLNQHASREQATTHVSINAHHSD